MNKSNFYLTNGKYDPKKSEARRKELKENKSHKPKRQTMKNSPLWESLDSFLSWPS